MRQKQGKYVWRLEQLVSETTFLGHAIKNKVTFCYLQEVATLFRDNYASSYVLPKRLFQWIYFQYNSITILM